MRPHHDVAEAPGRTRRVLHDRFRANVDARSNAGPIACAFGRNPQVATLGGLDHHVPAVDRIHQPKPPSGQVVVHAEVIDQGQVIATGYGPPDSDLVISISNPRLWSPSNPYLYDLRVRLIRGGRYIDTVGSYFGMRKIEVSSVEGVSRLKINGKTLFQMGVLDQGYWPDGIYTAPTDQALKYDIEVTKWLGYNLIRKHMKVEPDRWYYWADRLGILVWQDMPMGNNWSEWGQEHYRDELGRKVRQLHYHPSVIMWVLFNERWGEFDVASVTAGVKSLDPTRLVIGATGYADEGVGDAISFHSYNRVEVPEVGTGGARVDGQFATLALLWPLMSPGSK